MVDWYRFEQFAGRRRQKFGQHRNRKHRVQKEPDRQENQQKRHLLKHAVKDSKTKSDQEQNQKQGDQIEERQWANKLGGIKPRKFHPQHSLFAKWDRHDKTTQSLQDVRLRIHGIAHRAADDHGHRDGQRIYEDNDGRELDAFAEQEGPHILQDDEDDARLRWRCVER